MAKSGNNLSGQVECFFAHSLRNHPLVEWEPLERHLQLVANGDGDFPGAAGFADAFGAKEWGRLAGLWHDLGKYSNDFQNYIRQETEIGDEHRSDVIGRVDHSTAGARHAASLGPLGLQLAYCIAGHHAGLPDNVGSESSLSLRLKKQIPSYTAAPAKLMDLPLPPFPKLRPPREQKQASFSAALFVRMLFSCLVDADFLATESFVDPMRSTARPRDNTSMSDLLARLDDYLKGKIRFDTEVNRRRQEVLVACRDKASLPPGLFSLEVPTGGGKTLSSLAFALAHASTNQLHRVIYAIPFTSIIEQTADVFREALGDLAANILEHHSSLEIDDPERQSQRLRLAAENWDASIIVTTNVQLFESLFASRTSRCRKLHRLARSVIILDEAQMLPANLLAPTLAALDELVRNYGASLVLCTATQPALEWRESFPIGLQKPVPIIDAPLDLHEALKRTKVELVGRLSNEEIARRMLEQRRVLCIVNSRRHASELFNLIRDADAFHLSANMCAAHRSETVNKIRTRLASNGDCRVVSTQVIEAGIDVDFPVVFRAAAGLDSIAQAAGRCNREGQLRDAAGQPTPGQVFVFDYDEKANPPTRITLTAAAHFREIVPEYADDLLSPRAIDAYFRLHYWHRGGDAGRGWDKGRGGRSVLGCFALDPTELHAQFREAAEAYQFIEDAQTSIVVPFSEVGRSLVEELQSMPEQPDPQWLRSFDRRAQRYCVGVHESALDKLINHRTLLERHGRYYVANPKAYSHRKGLQFNIAGLNPEMLVL